MATKKRKKATKKTAKKKTSKRKRAQSFLGPDQFDWSAAKQRSPPNRDFFVVRRNATIDHRTHDMLEEAV